MTAFTDTHIVKGLQVSFFAVDLWLLPCKLCLKMLYLCNHSTKLRPQPLFSTRSNYTARCWFQNCKYGLSANYKAFIHIMPPGNRIDDSTSQHTWFGVKCQQYTHCNTSLQKKSVNHSDLTFLGRCSIKLSTFATSILFNHSFNICSLYLLPNFFYHYHKLCATASLTMAQDCIRKIKTKKHRTLSKTKLNTDNYGISYYVYRAEIPFDPLITTLHNAISATPCQT